MAEFETKGTLEIQVDQRSLRDARQQVEDEIGSVEVAVQAQTGGPGGSTGAARRASRDRAMSRQLLSDQGDSLLALTEYGDENLVLNETRNDLLRQIIDELEDLAFQAGQGGGGGSLPRPRTRRGGFSRRLPNGYGTPLPEVVRIPRGNDSGSDSGSGTTGYDPRQVRFPGPYAPYQPTPASTRFQQQANAPVPHMAQQGMIQAGAFSMLAGGAAGASGLLQGFGAGGAGAMGATTGGALTLPRIMMQLFGGGGDFGSKQQGQFSGMLMASRMSPYGSTSLFAGLSNNPGGTVNTGGTGSGGGSGGGGSGGTGGQELSVVNVRIGENGPVAIVSTGMQNFAVPFSKLPPSALKEAQRMLNGQTRGASGQTGTTQTQTSSEMDTTGGGGGGSTVNVTVSPTITLAKPLSEVIDQLVRELDRTKQDLIAQLEKEVTGTSTAVLDSQTYSSSSSSARSNGLTRQ